MMNKKGIATTFILLIIVLLTLGSITGYIFIRNKHSIEMSTTNVSYPTVTTTVISDTMESETTTTKTETPAASKADNQQTCDSLCKSKWYYTGDCIGSLGDYLTPPPVAIGPSSDCSICYCRPKPRYSCISPDDQIMFSLAGNCKYDPKGKYTSYEECEEKCPVPSCVDSDGGHNIHIKGTVTLKGDIAEIEKSDTCAGQNIVSEVDCVHSYTGSPAREIYSIEYCPSGYVCQDGACVLIK